MENAVNCTRKCLGVNSIGFAGVVYVTEAFCLCVDLNRELKLDPDTRIISDLDITVRLVILLTLRVILF